MELSEGTVELMTTLLHRNTHMLLTGSIVILVKTPPQCVPECVPDKHPSSPPGDLKSDLPMHLPSTLHLPFSYPFPA